MVNGPAFLPRAKGAGHSLNAANGLRNGNKGQGFTAYNGKG